MKLFLNRKELIAAIILTYILVIAYNKISKSEPFWKPSSMLQISSEIEKDTLNLQKKGESLKKSQVDELIRNKDKDYWVDYSRMWYYNVFLEGSENQWVLKFVPRRLSIWQKIFYLVCRWEINPQPPPVLLISSSDLVLKFE